MSAEDRTIIVGAGVAGLTLAHRLAKDGRRVTVLERDAVAGGLAKSYCYGDYQFDLGPHRFYTEEPEVDAFINEILGDDTLVIPRSSAVYMGNRFIEWPLRPSALLGIRPGLLLKVLGDLFRKEGGGDASFEEYIIGRYGRTLYEIFFRPYTEKFLGIPCSETAREWAVAGIDRATIDRNAGVSDLFALAGSLLRHRPPLRFIYPRSGAIGVFVEKLVADIRSKGGEVLLNSGVTGAEVRNGSVVAVTTATERHSCSGVVWTGSLQGLADCLGQPAPRLEYLSLLLYNYRLTTPCQVPYQWCYFGEAGIPFNRVSFPTLFNPVLAPSGCSGLCVEVTCRIGDRLWNEPEAREGAIREALLQNRLIPSPEAINGMAIERVADAYPVYRTGFQEKRDRFIRGLPTDNLIVAGRTGGFWYNNMDNSIAEALQLAVKPEQKEMRYA